MNNYPTISDLQEELKRFIGVKFPESTRIGICTLPSGEKWACAAPVAEYIKQLEAKVK